MTNDAMVFRTDATLGHVEGTIADLKGAYEDVSIQDKGETFNYDLTEALEVSYLLDLADATVKSARARTESRGAHARDDFATRNDEEWMKHTLATLNDDGSISLNYKPVIGGRYEPMERKY